LFAASAGLVVAAGMLAGTGASVAAEAATVVPSPGLDEPTPATAPTETAVLAGGCFWGVQGTFEHVRGVLSAVSGYAGGDARTAQYLTVSTGMTRHAESVQVTFDPRRISYGRLLQIYFSVVHDPTQLNRQGPDSGPQYRSTIFAANEQQARIAHAYIEQLDRAHVYPKPVATTVEPLKGFYPAEAYHQDFLVHNPNHPYIVFNDLPKIENLKRLFPAVFQAEPVLVGAAKP
jgi:peptide-methionine (S)-S-oxide reductase